MSIALLFGTSISANASSSGSWNVYYIPSGSASVSNQSSTVTVDYYSGGYIANCSSISGTNGRQLTITSSSAGGMSTIYITSTGNTKSWKMNSSTSGSVYFKVKALTGYKCISTGTISINN